MRDLQFTAEQVVRRPRDEVFEFFSQPQNLETITPPWLGFRMVSQTTTDIREGTEFSYRLKVRMFPVRWRSRIVSWAPNEAFTDIQLEGPYAKWHHAHEFEDHPDGTLVRDRVSYRLPFGRLGQLAAGWLVTSDVRRIFEYRRQRISELLEDNGSGASF